MLSKRVVFFFLEEIRNPFDCSQNPQLARDFIFIHFLFFCKTFIFTIFKQNIVSS